MENNANLVDSQETPVETPVETPAGDSMQEPDWTQLKILPLQKKLWYYDTVDPKIQFGSAEDTEKLAKTVYENLDLDRIVKKWYSNFEPFSFTSTTELFDALSKQIKEDCFEVIQKINAEIYRIFAEGLIFPQPKSIYDAGTAIVNAVKFYTDSSAECSFDFIFDKEETKLGIKFVKVFENTFVNVLYLFTIRFDVNDSLWDTAVLLFDMFPDYSLKHAEFKGALTLCTGGVEEFEKEEKELMARVRAEVEAAEAEKLAKLKEELKQQLIKELKLEDPSYKFTKLEAVETMTSLLRTLETLKIDMNNILHNDLISFEQTVEEQKKLVKKLETILLYLSAFLGE